MNSPSRSVYYVETYSNHGNTAIKSMLAESMEVNESQDYD